MRTAEIVQHVLDAPLPGGRRIVAIAGAPASGKSTLAQELVAHLPNACVIPMDGFHRDNDDLERDGLLPRKGAPETFDADGFVQQVRRLRSTSDVTFPTFDRTADRVVPKGGLLLSSVETVLVEGNYLLLDRAPWTLLADLWDLKVMIDVPLSVLEERLIDRWLNNGHDRAAAVARARENDIPNARTVVENSLPADLTVKTG